MKRTLKFVFFMLVMIMASLSVKAQEVTIVLLPGWNWISYPKAVVMDVATAFGDFVPMESDIIKSRYAFSEYYNGSWVGNMQEFTPGVGYMYYSNRTDTISFVFAEVTSQIVVTTAAPTNITSVSATSGGSVASSDGSYVYVFEKGICWATHPAPTAMNDFHTICGSGSGSFTAEMTNLSLNTMYYVRAYVVTLDGTFYGETMSFTTLDGIPDVSTAVVTDILGNAATCGGTVADNVGLDVIARGVCWNIESNPTISDSHTEDSTGVGDFTSFMTGLDVSTTYYVRAYATTSQGTGYGEEVLFTTRDGIPGVNTVVVTNILGAYATGGGEVVDDGGLEVISRGVCWSKNPNPTLNDSLAINGSGVGEFSCRIIGLTIDSTYYVRAYATTTQGTGYGEEVSFTANPGLVEYVDLGLPSGTLWATCNVGADSPEDYGDYFAWGDIYPKEFYEWSTYQYSNGSPSSLTKYCGVSNYGYNGFTDSLSVLLPEDDAATANWGADWHTPSEYQLQELYQNTNHVWTTMNGVIGRLFTASNGNTLFMPAAGYYDEDDLVMEGEYGGYWSSTLYYLSPFNARDLYFNSANSFMGGYRRCYGQSVRAVRFAIQE